VRALSFFELESRIRVPLEAAVNLRRTVEKMFCAGVMLAVAFAWVPAEARAQKKPANTNNQTAAPAKPAPAPVAPARPAAVPAGNRGGGTPAVGGGNRGGAPAVGGGNRGGTPAVGGGNRGGTPAVGGGNRGGTPAVGGGGPLTLAVPVTTRRPCREDEPSSAVPMVARSRRTRAERCAGLKLPAAWLVAARW